MKTNNCIYLKQKLNKNLECKKQKKIINIKECNNCKFKEYKTISVKTPKRSSKITKLERNRKSVFTDNLDQCIICGRKKEHLHEVFYGKNRLKSMEYGFVIPLCSECHVEMHLNKNWQDLWHIRGQEYFEKFLGSRDEFIEVFGKNYL